MMLYHWFRCKRLLLFILVLFVQCHVGDLQCPQKCHLNAQCIELVFGGRKCVCNPGFEGDGIECAGNLSCALVELMCFS